MKSKDQKDVALRMRIGIVAFLLGSLLAACQSVSEPALDRRPTTDELAQTLATQGASTILLLQHDPAKVKEYITSLPAHMLPYGIAYLAKDHQRFITGNEEKYTVVFYYNERAPEESLVVTRHHFKRPWATNLTPYEFTYFEAENRKPSSPLIIVNESRAGGSGGTITYTLIVDHKRVRERTVQIR